MTVTPEVISKEVLNLCKKINTGTRPQYVSVDVMPGAQYNDCFINVKDKVNNDGGSIQYGWCIWEWKNVLIEGEFHAVWRSPNGEIVDVTPKQNGEDRILFLPDNRRTFNGIDRIDNIRMALRKNIVIEKFIKNSEERYREMELLSKGQFGIVSITPSERLLQLQSEAANLLNQINILSTGRNDPCPCGSGEKYKKCCGA